ncbi:MAG: hypothetical protein FRX49_08217 [Trebouxia sp. A1-2]|nr:MAG: hypothetical protein FRX49_08217 [Trebouxia sp. A1-2]
MPSSEATRTPATSRKRARCQPPAAASLSLLAVPKLKCCDSVPADIQTGRGRVNGGSKLKAAQPFQASSTETCRAVTAGTPGDKENQPVRLNQATGPLANQSMPQLSSVQLEQQASKGIEPQLLGKVSSASIVKAMDRVVRVSQQATVSSPASDTRKSKSAAIVSHNVHAASSPGSQHVVSEVNPDPSKQANLAMLATSPGSHAEDEQECHVGDVPLACQTAIYNRRDVAGRRTRHLRRSTIAPGQDTAAQVAAMTAELSRLAEDMLPQTEELVNDKKAGRLVRKGQDSKDLRQRLLDSWDGKTYYERLQADAEGQQSCNASELGQAAMVLDKPGIAHAHARPALGVARKARQDGGTPRPSKNRLTSAASPSRQPVVMSPELLGSTEAKLQTQQQDKGNIVEGNEMAEPHPNKAPETKRLPPLPPTVRTPQHSQQAGKAQQHGISNGSGQVRGGHQSLHHQQPRPRQQQQNNAERSSKSASKTGATSAQPQGDHQPVKGKAGSAKADEHPITAAQTECTVNKVISGSTVPIHAAAEGHAEETGHSQPVQSKINTGRVKSALLDHQAATDSAQQRQIGRKGRGKADTSVTPWGQHAVAMQPGRAPGEVAAYSEARSAHGAGGSHNKGQQQVARLTASNTALLSELVELQGDKTALEKQLRREHEARKAADADSANLSEQLQQEKTSRATAEQQGNKVGIVPNMLQQA